MKFEWDIEKERKNIQKHGVNFEEASLVFADPFSLSMFDVEHSNKEERYIMLGKSLKEALLIVVHTFKDASGVEVVRIISARRATNIEKNIYEQRSKK